MDRDVKRPDTPSQDTASFHDLAVLRAILQTAVDGIITINVNGIVSSVNPAAERIFGYTSAELVGYNVSQLMAPPDDQQHDEYLRAYCRTGHAKVIGIGREVVGRRKDGTLFPLELSVSEWEVGAEKFFTGLVRDITERNALQRELARMYEELERRIAERTEQLHAAQAELLRQERLATLGKVAGGISHEIRNPLNAIKTSAYYLLKAPDLTSDKLSEHLLRIDRQVSLANEVVSALSNFARLPVPIVRSFDVGACVREAVETTEINDKHPVHVTVAPGLPHARADDSQIRVAIRNLVRNARDAMRSGGRIHVKVEQLGGEIIVSVIDSGSGMSEQQRARIAEPLFTTKPDGLGLGLAITWSILQHNQARLTVDSRPNVGSTFRIHLRVDDTTDETPQRDSAK